MKDWLCFLLVISFVKPLQSFAQRYAIQQVTVIPMDVDRVLPDKTVLIENGIIKKIEDYAAFKLPANTIAIDGKGKYLIPGLFDMHAHFFYEQGSPREKIPLELKIMLANGVTTARIMNGCPIYQDAKIKVAKGEWPGPNLVVVSPQFVGSWPWKSDTISPKEIVTSVSEAVNAVRKYKKQGYDAIKITFMVQRSVYDAIIQTAKEENIKVVGHVGPAVKLPAALAAGEQIEHMDEFIDMLLPDTSYNHGMSVSDMNIWSKNAWATVEYLDESKISALVKKVKDAGVFVTPTQYFFKTSFAVGQTDEEIKNLPDFDYIPASLKETRYKIRDHYWKNVKIDELKRNKYLRIRNEMIRQMQIQGVPIMAGSDSPEWFMVQGFTLHKELQALADAGLTPYEVLRTATINPATFLQEADKRGIIKVGKVADLILLDKNPLENIKHTTAIHGVFCGKEWYDRKMLDALLEEAKQLGK